MEQRSFTAAEMKTHRNGDVEAYVSTEAVDRVGDIIRADGWELENFKKSGAPVLWSHEYSNFGGSVPLIGTAVAIEAQRKGLWAVTRFHEKTQLSRDAAVLAREKILPSWSVGFAPLAPPESRMVEGRHAGYIFTKQELLEYSLVAVPANPEATSKAEYLKRAGRISESMYLAPCPPRAQSWHGHTAAEAEDALKVLRALEVGMRRHFGGVARRFTKYR